MCGIVGLISKKTIDINLMLNSIIHRGPDSGASLHFSHDFDFNIKFGHRRLSIIDITSNSDQPFTSSINSNSIVFNGEIYNYEELRNDYLSNFNFKSNGDTEVIIELYNRYGPDSFKLLKGMYAFAIYDYSNSKVVLCRDSIGIKPLYYFFDKDELYFASEIKALNQIQHLNIKISKSAITEFFLNGFIYEPNTGFENLNKVFPGTYIEIFIEKQLDLKTTTYWRPNPLRNNIKIDFEKIIKNEFNSHLVSDVPIGLFYSGGIDSSVLLSLSNAELHSYFINSKSDVKASREFEYAEKIAKSLNKKFEVLDISPSNKNSDKLLKNIQDVAEKSEELIADYTFYVSQLISSKAKNQRLKVMLSGMGGDELFLGYPRYKLVQFNGFFKIIYFFITAKLFPLSSKFSKKIERFKAFFENKPFVFRYTNLIGYFHENELPDLILNFEDNTLHDYERKLNSLLINYEHLSNIKKAQILDLYGFLSHNFMVADKSSMQESIEIRVPLATPDLFNYCLQTDVKYLLNFWSFKIPLLNILSRKLNLNLFRRPKEGFNPDLDSLINSIGIAKIKEALDDNLFNKYINKEFVNNIIREHMDKTKNNSYRIYQLLYFKFWLNFNHIKN
jgi:asparagine synthase (glutamine-hydrolysing)